jgi:hypothetical protein
VILDAVQYLAKEVGGMKKRLTTIEAQLGSYTMVFQNFAFSRLSGVFRSDSLAAARKVALEELRDNLIPQLVSARPESAQQYSELQEECSDLEQNARCIVEVKLQRIDEDAGLGDFSIKFRVCDDGSEWIKWLHLVETATKTIDGGASAETEADEHRPRIYEDRRSRRDSQVQRKRGSRRPRGGAETEEESDDLTKGGKGGKKDKPGNPPSTTATPATGTPASSSAAPSSAASSSDSKKVNYKKFRKGSVHDVHDDEMRG